MSLIDEKNKKLQEYLNGLGNLAVAFSGGVDSTFLLESAREALGDNVIAVTARSATYPERELSGAHEFCLSHHIRHEIIMSEELDIEGYRLNPPDRCYLCKKELFAKIEQAAQKYGIKNIAEGSNCDDLGDFRPGMRAVAEMKVLSPLREAGLFKQEIRELSQKMGLPTWDKPSFACLSSRIPYGEEITREKLAVIDAAETFLRNLGFTQVRVRHHGKIARIELPKKEMRRIFDENLSEQINRKLHEIGFTYVALDLNGYHTGSMNAVLDRKTVDALSASLPSRII